MSKKKQTKTARKRKPSRIPKDVQALAQAAERSRRDQGAPAVALPSHRAMMLANSVISRVGRVQKGSEAAQVQTVAIAEILDSALRMDRAVAEVEGHARGRAFTEREVVQGIMARIAMNSLTKPQPKTIVLSFNEAKMLHKLLKEAGYSDGIPRQTQEAWQLANQRPVANDDDMHASLKAG
jgi:hypothetical protein